MRPNPDLLKEAAFLRSFCPQPLLIRVTKEVLGTVLGTESILSLLCALLDGRVVLFVASINASSNFDWILFAQFLVLISNP